MPEVNEQELRAVDRELSQLLAVEASPEFAAKVRARIEQEPAHGGLWWLWALASCAAAAVIVAAVVIGARRGPAVVPPASVHADIHLPPREAAQTQMQMPDRVTPLPRTILRRQRMAGRAEPEILFDPSLAAAVRRFVIEQPTLPEVPPAPSLDPVVVEPLKVQEITNAGGAGL
jgi:hypothetical protein